MSDKEERINELLKQLLIESAKLISKDEKLEKLSMLLKDRLLKITCGFFEGFDDIIENGSVEMNILMSAYMSAFFSIMYKIGDENGCLKEIKALEKEVMKAFEDSEIISSVKNKS